MEKEFIPYEQALTLKELGFNEPCIRGWDKNGKIWYHPDSDIVLDNPTFSQAFRFFREKYNLDCSVILHVATNGSTKGVYFEERSYKYQIRKSFKNPLWIEFDSFKTYEEAELECLRKLIELVKKQK